MPEHADAREGKGYVGDSGALAGHFRASACKVVENSTFKRQPKQPTLKLPRPISVHLQITNDMNVNILRLF